MQKPKKAMDEFSRSLAGLVGNVAFITLLAR
jgi:hypothetical protein